MKIGACAVLAMVWASCYSFELFPWSGGDMEWWYLPHLATLLAANWIVLVWAVERAVDGTFGNRAPSGLTNPPTEEECQRPSPTPPKVVTPPPPPPPPPARQIREGVEIVHPTTEKQNGKSAQIGNFHR